MVTNMFYTYLGNVPVPSNAYTQRAWVRDDGITTPSAQAIHIVEFGGWPYIHGDSDTLVAALDKLPIPPGEKVLVYVPVWNEEGCAGHAMRSIQAFAKSKHQFVLTNEVSAFN